MRRAVAVAAVVAAMSAAGASGVAFAGSGDAPNDQPATGASARALGGAQAPNARLAAYVSNGGTVVRSKAVAQVTHPADGQYCIKPKGKANIDLAKVMPLVSIDWSSSSGDALMAHWRSSNGPCPSDSFNVQTLNGEDGTFDVGDGASFVVVIP